MSLMQIIYVDLHQLFNVPVSKLEFHTTISAVFVMALI